jgi:pimeloyl-ACP methyl ester carboxylesterase
MDTIKNDLAVFQTGKENNQSIIFIHGFPFDHKMWDLQVNYFKKDYHCITYDIPGLGQSPTGDGQYTMERLVDDLFNLMESYNLDKPVLCGLSMGGYIALRAIERNEGIFKALVLCDTKSEADNNAGKINRAKGIKEINNAGAEKFAEIFVQKCFSEEFIKTNKEEYEKVLMRSKKSDPVGLKGCLLAMAGRTDTTEYLAKIKIPVLVLGGGEDKLTPPSVMKTMGKKISHSEFLLVPEAGHVTSIENPKFFNTALEKFLKEI